MHHAGVRPATKAPPVGAISLMARHARRQAAVLLHARDGQPISIAGLWDAWKDIETGSRRSPAP